jgi:hypothetical protein
MLSAQKYLMLKRKKTTPTKRLIFLEIEKKSSYVTSFEMI